MYLTLKMYDFKSLNVSKLKKIGKNELPNFCKSFREELIKITSNTGGHVGPNLGVIELTVALYYVFDFPKDTLIWDIGHQTYVQQLITNRYKKLITIRKDGMAPGYSNANESKYDTVTSSHAGSSLSLAIGVNHANFLNKNKNFSIAVCGDASFVEGSIQEALNHMPKAHDRLIFIINDNETAIDNNWGGYHDYFKKNKPNKIKKSKFQYLNIDYYSTIDGHNVVQLVNFLKKIKLKKKKCIVHIKTKKAKGLEKMASSKDDKLHWHTSFDMDSYISKEMKNSIGYEKFVDNSMVKILNKKISKKKIFIITPAVRGNAGFNNTFKIFKKNTLDVSIAEQHAITFACGMALKKFKPIVGMESTFMIRSLGQIKHDICINNLPVLIMAARSGHGGADHITHNALKDLSYLRCIPNLNIFFPYNSKDIKKFVNKLSGKVNGPTILLFAKGNTDDDIHTKYVCDSDHIDNLKGKNLVLSIGAQNKNAQKLTELMNRNKFSTDHIVVRNINPFSQKLIKNLKKYKNIITLEEHVLDGGFGSLILEKANENNLLNKINIYRFGFKKNFIEAGSRDYIYKKHNLDFKSIYKRVKSLIK